jgi:hypothetical protein
MNLARYACIWCRTAGRRTCTVKNLIGKIEAMEVGEELYDAKMRVLGEMVKHHIKEEEEELFPGLEAAKMNLDAVGKEISERKEELMSEMQA